MLVVLIKMVILLEATSMLLRALNIMLSLKSLCPPVKCSLITVVVLIGKGFVILFGFLVRFVIVDATITGQFQYLTV